MRIYIHPKCSTCKNALQFLQTHFRESQYSLIDITSTPPSRAELEQMLHFYQGHIKKLFNTSGIQYRELGLTEKLKTMNDDAALQLLSQNGMLVKRPFLLGNGIGLLGFKESEWSKTLVATF